VNIAMLFKPAIDVDARLSKILDLFLEDGWRISNDVGNVKTHLLRSGRRSRLS